MDGWDIVPKLPGKTMARSIAVGICPSCRRHSVEIFQHATEWADPKTKRQPLEWAPPEMECRCGATIVDVNFPLDPTWWQMSIENTRPRVVSIRAQKVRRYAAR
jgi:hypothetical protein